MHRCRQTVPRFLEVTPMALGGLGTGEFGSTMQLLPPFKDGTRTTCCLLPLIWKAKGFGSERTPATGIMIQRTIRPRIRAASISQRWLAVLTILLAKGVKAAWKIRCTPTLAEALT